MAAAGRVIKRQSPSSRTMTSETVERGRGDNAHVALILSPSHATRTELLDVSHASQPSPAHHGPQRRGRRQSSDGAQAGLDILRAGGNAVDASVAISLALGVCEPMMSGLGGDGFYQVYTAKERPRAVLQRHRVPRYAATPERFRARGIAVRGPLSVSTPGCSRGLRRDAPRARRLAWRRCRPGDRTRARRLRRHPSLPPLRRRRRAVLAADGCAVGRCSSHGAPVAASASPTSRGRSRRSPRTARRRFYRGRLAKRLARRHARGRRAGRRTRPGAFQPRCRTPIAHRLSRLPRHPDAAELHRLHHAADAEDRRALRLRRRSIRCSASTCWWRRRSAPSSTASATAPIRGSATCRWIACCPMPMPTNAPPSIDMAARRRHRAGGTRGGGRRHHVFLRGRCRGQRGVGHPEPQFRLRLRRDGRRHRRAAEQPHGVLASGPGPRQPARPRQARAPHDERADGVQGRRAVGVSKARRAPTTRCR